jgi:hypothetical protein
VTVLPLGVLAVIVILKTEPAVCGLLIALKTKWSRITAFTVNELLVPDFEEPEVPIVIPEPDAEIDTEPVQVPDENVPVLVGLMVPKGTDRVLVPV